MTMPAADFKTTNRDRVDRDGWAAFPAFVEAGLLDRIVAEVKSVGEARGGVRDLLAHSAGAQTLARHSGVRQIAASVLGPDCFVTRAILFDKSERANWKVVWHQDLTIAVKEQLEAPGFGAWSVKAGIVHVQPPVAALERMLAVRVHLDDCGLENGPVRVLPGSHLEGRLNADQTEIWKQRVPAVECPVPRGGILIFRPLILHASSPATVPSHRRVVHFEFAAGELPSGLQWHARV